MHNWSRIFYICWDSNISSLAGAMQWVPHPLRGPSPLHTLMGTSPAHWPWTLMVWRKKRRYWRKRRRRVTRQMQRWLRCTTTTPTPIHTPTIPRCIREGCCYEGLNRHLRPAWATWRARWPAPWSTDGGRPLKRIMSLQGDPAPSAHQMDPSSLMPTLPKLLQRLQSIQASGWLNIPTHRAKKLEELQVSFIRSATSTRNVTARILRNGKSKPFLCFFSKHENTK